tara:strand:- start:326 stop:580 length:255 start_codon:yes stop_codon:yes gene_type:complete
MISLKSQKLLDETTNGKWRQFVHPSKIEKESVMAKKKKGQFDHYKKWTTNEGYTFMAKDKEDAELYLKHMGHTDLGKLTEVKNG